jgi:hypothetical protein
LNTATVNDWIRAGFDLEAYRASAGGVSTEGGAIISSGGGRIGN